jgi:hypothetical protein
VLTDVYNSRYEMEAIMKRLLLAAALVCLGSSSARAEDTVATGRINSDRMLVCKSRIDAESFATSDASLTRAAGEREGFSTFEGYMSELLLSGRCSASVKGTKVFISDQGNTGETVAIRVPGETEYRYVDASVITRDGCPMNELARRNLEEMSLRNGLACVANRCLGTTRKCFRN